uniref:Uncharacterized protein n=1 Tax=Knipowitschia caucasica TaxID=637954 RepID=A0AAV2IUL9_KNICA
MDWLPNPSWSANVLRASWVFLSVPAIVLTWGRIILDMRQSWAAELGLYFFHQGPGLFTGFRKYHGIPSH